MTLPLLDRIVYGPVRSRRLGASLGINLLPAGMKICNMDCAYCQYGWTRGAARYRGQGTGWPAALMLGAALFVFDFSATLFGIHYLSLRQAITPDHLLGRMTATMRFLTVAAAPLGREQLVEVGLGLGGGLGVVLDAEAPELWLVGQCSDQDGCIVKVGGRHCEFPLVRVRKAMRTRELDVLDECRQVFGDDAVVRTLIPFPPIHVAYYRCPRGQCQRGSNSGRYVSTG